MRTEVTTKPLWKPGDIGVYKPPGKRGHTAIVLGRYDNVRRTQEPRYVIGILELPSVQYSKMDIKDNVRVLFSALHLGEDEKMRPVSRRAVRGFFADWIFQEVYDQESCTGNYRLWRGGEVFYEELIKRGYQMLAVDKADTSENKARQRPIRNLRFVMQHSLHHPLERTKVHKVDKKRLQDSHN